MGLENGLNTEGRKTETKQKAKDFGLCHRAGEMVPFTKIGNTGEGGSLKGKRVN